jgi:hypothetical protein
MRISTALVSHLAAASVVACAARGVEEVPFAIPPDSLLENIRTIVVTPVTTPDDFVIPGDAAAELESALEEQLQQAGFAIVPSFEYIGMWQHIADEFGGFFDTYTGERDEELFEAATDRLRTELVERFQVDALLYPELWAGLVPFQDGVARWDGTSQVVFGAYGLSGEVNALSLVVSIEDMAGTELYSKGIGFATTEAWYKNSWLPLVLKGVIGDPRLVSTAVTSVLTPIRVALASDSSLVP